MAKRRKLSRKGSKKLFSRTARKTNKKNMSRERPRVGAMRGGGRL